MMGVEYLLAGIVIVLLIVVILRQAALEKNQDRALSAIMQAVSSFTQLNETKLENIRESVERRLTDIQQDNSQQLERMRHTVDEKLHATLEKRLGESFALVSHRLEQVHKGLGEMQHLASGVGDLKKVLTNVKTRGAWGEAQLGNLLEQLLAPQQYACNVVTKETSRDPVEFVIKLPEALLPIDAKFPIEDYERLILASETGDVAGVEQAVKNLEGRIKLEAKTIKEKYIAPPVTTDFAIMFLPVEGLYAEVLRRPGLVDNIRRDYGIIVAGPTTIAAILNSLQMGFRSLAVQQRAAEVRGLLGVVKNEFGKFADLLDKTKEKLIQATNTIEDASRKSRTIEKKLDKVEQLPVDNDLKSIESI